MNTVRCKICKKPYIIEVGFPTLCPECSEKERDECERVRSFVRARPGVTIDVVERETNVSRKKIMHYIYDERLEVSSRTETCLRCRLCSSKIYTGTLCDRCKNTKVVG